MIDIAKKNVRVKCEFCQLSEKPLYIHDIEDRGNLTRSHMFNIAQIHIMLVFINCKLSDNFMVSVVDAFKCQFLQVLFSVLPEN